MKKSIVLFGMLLAMTSLSAQEISLRTLSFPGLAYRAGAGYFYGGGGLELAFQKDLPRGAYRLGLEYRIIDWGNQVGLNLGYVHPYLQGERWQLSGLANLQLGLVPFYQKSLLSWAIGYHGLFRWQSKKRAFYEAGLGIRYSNSPGYVEFGPINRLFEVPVRVGVGWKLGNRKTAKPQNRKTAKCIPIAIGTELQKCRVFHSPFDRLLIDPIR
jgi:hypothetical protein